jgi:hypothetical protein
MFNVYQTTRHHVTLTVRVTSSSAVLLQFNPSDFAPMKYSTTTPTQDIQAKQLL